LEKTANDIVTVQLPRKSEQRYLWSTATLTNQSADLLETEKKKVERRILNKAVEEV